MIMETLFLFAIGLVIYLAYYAYVYKKTKSYKEKQLVNLIEETYQLETEHLENLPNTEVFLDSLMNRKEQQDFLAELDNKEDKEKSELMKKLMQPKESNMADRAIAQRLLLMFDKLKTTKFKYIRLMERLKYVSIDEQLKAAQDWNYYVRLFNDESSADPNNFHQVLVILEEIEKRFDEKLRTQL